MDKRDKENMKKEIDTDYYSTTLKTFKSKPELEKVIKEQVKK